jgi:hypothetical protein
MRVEMGLARRRKAHRIQTPAFLEVRAYLYDIPPSPSHAPATQLDVVCNLALALALALDDVSRIH